MTGLSLGWLVVASLCGPAQSAEGASAALAERDAVLASQVSGQAQVVDGVGQGADLVAFSKLRVGDRLELAEGADVQLIFLHSGRVEQWVGPASLVVAANQATAQDAAQPTAVGGQGPVGTTLAELPQLLQQAEGTAGGYTLVRGDGMDEDQLDDIALEDLARLRAAAAVLRAALPDQDVLPELLLATRYLSYGLADQAVGVLQEAVTRCPDCREPRLLLDWVVEPDQAAPAYQK